MASTQAFNIVLVHGGFVDGAGWEGVYEILKKDGYDVSIVQNPTIVARRRCRRHQARSRSAGPARDPRRPFLWRCRDHRGGQRPEGDGARLHCRFRSGQGRVGGQTDQGPAARRARAADPAAAETASCSSTRQSSTRPLRPTLTRTRPRSWPTRKCRGASARSAARSAEPAWATKPSWYLVATEDKMIPPAAQRFMSKRAGATRSSKSAEATPSTCRSRRRWPH